tara:strand:+ start:207 stop:659 length:453 start_codon:yes stop_codon:yes gene_type:complete
MYIKTYLELINEARTPASICDEYDRDLENIEDKYRPKFLKMFFSLMDNWREHNDYEEFNEEYGGFDLLGSRNLEGIDLGETVVIFYITYHDTGLWMVSGSGQDDFGTDMDFDSDVLDLNTKKLSNLLRGILNIKDITKHYSVNAIKKINK